MTTAGRVAADVGLRTAGADDLAAMADVFVHAWRSGYRGIVPDTVIDAMETSGVARDLAVGLDDARLTTVVAVDTDGTPVGFTRFGEDAEHADGSYLAALYVHPAAGGLGIGRVLLHHALDAMPGRDVRLWVFEANARARDVYERAGFRLEGPRRTDPRWRTPQVLMRRPARNRPRPLPPLPDLELPPVHRLSTALVRRPLRRPFRTALRTVHALSAIEVTLHTPAGVQAIGTTVATPAITGDTEESILAALHGPITRALRRGPRTLAEALDAIVAAAPGVPSARAAADLALHHLAAGHAGLGGSGHRASPEPADAGWLPDLLGNRAVPVRSDLTVSVDSPSAMAAAALEAVAEGFGTLKLKLADPEMDVRRVAAVHAALGGPDRATVLRVDANQAWSPADAVRVLDGIATLGIELELVEQPVRADDIVGLARVRAASPWPVLADESVFTAEDVRRVADASAADLVNLKLLKCGGLGPARDVVAACAETGLGLIVGCMLEPTEGVAAARHLAAATADGPMAHDLDAGWWAAV